MASADLKKELSHRTIKEISIEDPRLFKPHDVKETDEWSWRRFKYEKWYVVLDCKTGHLKRWKLSGRK
jgi:hypothetical protein